MFQNYQEKFPLLYEQKMLIANTKYLNILDHFHRLSELKLLQYLYEMS